jgi:hypothetical protein
MSRFFCYYGSIKDKFSTLLLFLFALRPYDVFHHAMMQMKALARCQDLDPCEINFYSPSLSKSQEFCDSSTSSPKGSFLYQHPIVCPHEPMFECVTHMHSTKSGLSLAVFI